MRMMKRLAVCVLAAAMSLTMLTACGGDTPSAPETPSNPGTSQGSGSGNDNGNNNGGNNNGQKPGNEDENTLPTSWNASKTKAYMVSRGVSDTNIYVNGTLNIIDADTKQVTDSGKVIYAAKGNKIYVSISDSTGTARAYKSDADEYYVSEGDSWYKCTTSEQIQAAEIVLLTGQGMYKIPSKVLKFAASKEDRYYYENVLTQWSTGAQIAYSYMYTSDNQLAGVGCMMESAQDTFFLTSPVTITSNPSNSIFPNL